MSSANLSILDRGPGSTVLDMIGRTPLVRLNRFEAETPGVELYAKDSRIAILRNGAKLPVSRAGYARLAKLL